MKVLKDFRRLVDAVEKVAASSSEAARKQTETGPLLERLNDLEMTRAKWEAEVEAILLRAEGKLQAANNSEARERTMKKHREKHLDPFDLEGAEEPQAIPSGDAPGSEVQGLQPLRLDLEKIDGKQQALRAKFL